ncbi:MAG: aspartate kinase, partial [Clostridia bacterium]
MNILVQKFGGTSVANKEKLEIVAEKIISNLNKNKIIVVVSAQGKYTDFLINSAYTYSNNPDTRALDMLLCTGEMQTVSYLTMILKDKNIKTIGLTGAQAGIISTSNYTNAKIDTIYSENILNYLNTYNVVIVAGFQATDRFGNITTLGRGGSDLTAVAIASVLKANKCEIYTDVDGVYTSDPKIIKKTKLLKKISYNEMLEAASCGAKVLHNRSVKVAKKYNLNLLVKNTSNNTSGSLISKSNILEDTNIKFISNIDNLSKVSIIGDMIIENKNILSELFS